MATATIEQKLARYPELILQLHSPTTFWLRAIKIHKHAYAGIKDIATPHMTAFVDIWKYNHYNILTPKHKLDKS